VSPVLKSAKLENREKKVIVIVYDSTLTAPLPGRYLKQCIGGEGEAISRINCFAYGTAVTIEYYYY